MSVKVNLPELHRKDGRRREPPDDTQDEGELPFGGPEWRDEVTDVENVVRQRTQPHALPISRGDLKSRPFAELLAEIYRWRADGALLVMRGKDKKVVTFRAGRPIYVKSNVLEECLGRILIREKLITEEDCEESLRQMKTSYRQQGTVLIEMGRLSPHNLVYALGLQLQTKLFDLFTWLEGKYELDTRAEPPAQPIELEMTTAAIIHEGIKRGYSDGRVSNALKDARGRYPAPAPDPLYRFQEIGLEPEEAALLASIDGSRTVAQVEAKSPLRPIATRRLLLAMRIAQVIELESRPTRRSPAGAPPSALGAKVPTPPRLPPPPPPVDARHLPRPEGAPPPLRKGDAPAPPPRPPPSRTVAEQLAARLSGMRGKDHFELLGVPPEAPLENIRAAYLALAKEFHPDKHYSSASAEVRELAAEIYHLVGAA
ncbi:MAG: DUF4388 domain-containing protein, partial [Deltaproteobacteria bacterium]